MYNPGGPPLVVGGTLAVTGVSSLQIVGMAIIAISLGIAGLLMVRSARLRAHSRDAEAA